MAYDVVPCVVGGASADERHPWLRRVVPKTAAFLGLAPLRLEYALCVPQTPPPPAGFPVVFAIHGGAFMFGRDLTKPPKQLLNSLEAGEFAVALLSYRLTTEAGLWGDEAVTWPAQSEDLFAAIEDVRARCAAHGLDGGRLAVFGSSAGAFLAAYVATAGTKPPRGLPIKAAVAMFPPTDLATLVEDVGQAPANLRPGTKPAGYGAGAPESRLAGFALDGSGSQPPDRDARLASASAVNAAHAGAPPFFIAHGDDDGLVPTKQSARLASALEAAGVAVDFRVVAGAGHGGKGFPFADAIAFLVARL